MEEQEQGGAQMGVLSSELYVQKHCFSAGGGGGGGSTGRTWTSGKQRSDTGWKYRLFVCTSGVLTYYRKSMLARTHLVILPLAQASILRDRGEIFGRDDRVKARAARGVPDPSEFTITVQSGAEVWCLCLPDEAKRREWDSMLRQEIKAASGKNGSSSKRKVWQQSSVPRPGSGGNDGRGGGDEDQAPKPWVAQTRGMPKDVVPTRYLVTCGMDEAAAANRWAETWVWRRENDMDSLLECAYMGREGAIDELKGLALHCFHRRAKATGRIVYYDRLDPAAYKQILAVFHSDAKVAYNSLIKYYMLIGEYAYEHFEPDDPGGRTVTVYDLSNVSFWSLFGPTIDLAKEVTKICAAHYPERADKVFLINAPRFFTSLWKILKPFVDPRTTARMSIASGADRTELLDYIGAENVPVMYGGSDTTPPGKSPEEMQFQAFVKAAVRRGGASPSATLEGSSNLSKKAQKKHGAWENMVASSASAVQPRGAPLVIVCFVVALFGAALLVGQNSPPPGSPLLGFWRTWTYQPLGYEIWLWVTMSLRATSPRVLVDAVLSMAILSRPWKVLGCVCAAAALWQRNVLWKKLSSVVVSKAAAKMSLFIFNDNEEDSRSSVRGGNNAKIRPYNEFGAHKGNESAAGVPTGSNGKGYAGLTKAVKATIDEAVARIGVLLATGRYSTVVYSATSTSRKAILGDGIFTIAEAVKTYIVNEIYKIADGHGVTVVPSVFNRNDPETDFEYQIKKQLRKQEQE